LHRRHDRSPLYSVNKGQEEAPFVPLLARQGTLLAKKVAILMPPNSTLARRFRVEAAPRLLVIGYCLSGNLVGNKELKFNGDTTMPMLSKPTSAAQIALVYITLGALIGVWTGVWYWWDPPQTTAASFWLAGFALTGLTLLIIGLAVGQIGRAARHAELPPPEVTPAAVKAEQSAAERAPMAIPANPAMPVVAPNGPANPPGKTAPPVAVPGTPPVTTVSQPGMPVRGA
jgi:hypothetical protein